MDEFAYQNYLNGKLQNLTLNDVQEQREILRHQRELNRDAQKSYLRQAERAEKERRKVKNVDVQIYDNSTVIISYNGDGAICDKKVLFGCRIEEVLCYQRLNSDQKLWQIVFIEQGSDARMESQLYGEEFLRSKGKLKTTILAKYLTNDTRLHSVAWEWMQRVLISKLEGAEIEKIPSSPGWFHEDNCWHFWTAADRETLLLDEHICRFSVKCIKGLTVENALEALMCDAKRIADNKFVGVSLIFRCWALVGRLVEEDEFCFGAALIGEDAYVVAKTFFRTMENDIDTMNLDADHMGTIGRRVKSLQETPAIFLVYNPDCKSTGNRLDRVMSCMLSGRMDGENIPAAFVFCLKTFSCLFPLEEVVTIDVSKGRWREKYDSFEKIQDMIISNIENSGNFWVERLRQQYKKNLRENTDKILSMAKSMVWLCSNMFHDEQICESLYTFLQAVLHSGESEIIRQRSSKKGVLMEIFQEKVKEMVVKGDIFTQDRLKTSEECEETVIYFDSQYYFFTSNIFDLILKKMGIDSRSALSLKRQLMEQDMLKVYQKTGSRKPEFEVDFRIRNKQGKSEDLSGLAIKCEFFDEIGGIKLYERG